MKLTKYGQVGVCHLGSGMWNVFFVHFCHVLNEPAYRYDANVADRKSWPGQQMNFTGAVHRTHDLKVTSSRSERKCP